jgi:hypothetical protein
MRSRVRWRNNVLMATLAGSGSALPVTGTPGFAEANIEMAYLYLSWA